MQSSNCILFCSCSGRNFLSDNARRVITAGLQESGNKFITLPDLCGIAVKRKQELKEIVERADRIVVIACYPRAVRWLFAMAGMEWNADRIHVINFRQESAVQIVEQVKRLDFPGSMDAFVEGGEDQWDPWFPVIDYERCVDCRQCLSFCLFGVYEADKSNRVTVKHPGNCKNNCPACARICPKAAIIFPKHTESPIEGSEIKNEAELRDKIQANVNEILGSDIYAALAERRKKSKKLLIRRKDIEKAEQERSEFSGQG